MHARPDGAPSKRRRYRLNPYFFLADRKIWVSIAILLLAITYGFAAHLVGMAAGYASGSAGAYWTAVLPLVAVPVVLHLTAPIVWFRDRQVEIARYWGGNARWTHYWGADREAPHDEPPPDRRAVRSVCSRLGVTDDPDLEADVFALASEVSAVFARVGELCARLAGRDPRARNQPGIRVLVSRAVGSPYCHARAFGAVSVVFPLGARPDFASAPEGDLDQTSARREHQRLLLAHELSHVLLRDEPIALFADVRLVSVVSSLRTAAAMLLTVCLGAWIGLDSVHGEASGWGSAPLLAAASMVLVPLAWRLLRAHLREGARAAWLRGLLASGLGLLVLVVGVYLAGTTLTAARPYSDLASLLPTASVALVSALLFAQLCVHLGRRQMEYLADETAINAFAGSATRGAMERVLTRTAEVLRRAPRVTPPGDHAIGHSSPLRLSGRAAGWSAAASRQASRLAARLRASAHDARQRRAPLAEAWGPVASVGAGLIEQIERAVVLGVMPILQTHPTLDERVQVVRSPDLQAEQDPLIPLIYTAVPLVVLPYLVQRTLERFGLTAAPLDALLVLATVAFLGLFYLVARRPVRRREVGGELGEREVRSLHEVMAVGSGGAEPAARDLGRAVRGFSGEILRVVKALLIASALGTALAMLSERALTGGEQPVALDVLGFHLPPVPFAGSALAVSGLFLGWYLVVRFASLAQWHFYSGTGTVVNLCLQGLNLLKASLLTAFVGTNAHFVAIAVGDTSTVLSVAGGDRESTLLHGAIVGDPVHGSVVFIVVGMAVLFGVAYAAVVCWWPSLPSTVRCPLGHPVPMRWHGIVDPAGDRHGEDHAWLRCPVCDRPPQATGRLLSDDELEAPAWRKTSSGWFALLGLSGVTLLAIPIFMLGGALLLADEAGRCRRLGRLATEGPVGLAAFGACAEAAGSTAVEAAGGGPLSTALPRPPKVWSTIVVGAAGGEGLTALAEDAPHPLEEQTIARLATTWRCADWIHEARNRIGWLEACAQSAPETRPSEAECDARALSGRPGLACRCLWIASERPLEAPPGRLAAVASAHVLFGGARLVAHQAIAACGTEIARRQAPAGMEIARAWHDHLEGETGPRLFIALSQGMPPDAYLGAATPAGYPRPVSGHCVGHFRQQLPQIAAHAIVADGPTCIAVAQATRDSLCAPDSTDGRCRGFSLATNACRERYRHLLECLSPAHLRRVVSEGLVALDIQRAVAEQTGTDEGDADTRQRGNMSFATVLPTLLATAAVGETAQQFLTVAEAAEVLHETPDTRSCEARRQRLDVVSRLAEHGASEDGSGLPEFPDPARAALRDRQRELFCRLVDHAPEGTTELEIWWARLACDRTLDKDVSDHCRSWRWRPGAWAWDESRKTIGLRDCESRELSTAGTCETFLGVGDCATGGEVLRAEVRKLAYEEPFVVQDAWSAKVAVAVDPIVARAVEILALRAKLACEATGDDAEALLDRTLCAEYRRSALASRTREVPLAAQIARGLGLFDKPAPLEAWLEKDIAELIAAASKEVDSVRESAHWCEPGMFAGRHVALAELESLRAWASSLSFERLRGLDGGLDERFPSCRGATSGPAARERCLGPVLSRIQAVVGAESPDALQKAWKDSLNECLGIGREAVQAGVGLVLPALLSSADGSAPGTPDGGSTLRDRIRRCDWVGAWRSGHALTQSRATASARESRTPPPSDPHSAPPSSGAPAPGSTGTAPEKAPAPPSVATRTDGDSTERDDGHGSRGTAEAPTTELASPPPSVWMLLRELRRIHRAWHSHEAGLPEFLGQHYPGVRSAWASKEDPR